MQVMKRAVSLAEKIVPAKQRAGESETTRNSLND